MWEDDLVDEFLRELQEGDDADRIATLVDALRPPPIPPEEARAALLDALAVDGRFERYVAIVSSWMDVDEARARILLDGIGRPESWEAAPMPGVELFHISGGPAVAEAVTGFVRMPAGASFPPHRHLGEERVLVLAGSFVDQPSQRTFHAGDQLTMAPETSHHFTVRRGPDLLYLVVAQTGVQIGEHVFGPRSPEL